MTPMLQMRSTAHPTNRQVRSSCKPTDHRRATACCVHRRHRGSVRLYSQLMEPVYWPLPGLRLGTPDLLLRPTTEADLPAVSATLSADIATNPQLPRFPGLGQRTSHAVSAAR